MVKSAIPMPTLKNAQVRHRYFFPIKKPEAFASGLNFRSAVDYGAMCAGVTVLPSEQVTWGTAPTAAVV